jgi:cell division protein FtsB
MPSRTPATTKRKTAAFNRRGRTRTIVRVLLLVFALVVVVDAVVGEQGLVATRRARREQETLSAAVARQQQQNAQSREEIRRLKDDPKAIEEAARRDLRLIRPGEKVFVLKDLPSPAQ